jgi:Outer membrane protein beta-barrel domain
MSILKFAAVVSAASLTVLAVPLARADTGPYAAAGYGITGYETRCQGDACDRRDSGFRAAAGWQLARNWSLEAIYLDPGTFVASDVTAVGTPFHGRAHVSVFGANVGYSYPFGGVFSLGARAGAASVRAEFTPGPAPAIAGGKTRAQFLGGLYATWHFSPAWSARLDWDHTRAKMNRYDGDVNALIVGVQFGF